MVDIAPFRGLVYRADLANAPVYAPPYDVIDPLEQRSLLDRHEFNVVRLVLPGPFDRGDWHRDAAGTLESWREGRVLVCDRTARLYGYQQRFRLSGGKERVRTGFVARVRLAPYGRGIHRHERTTVGPREDRLRLMRATRANLSPVFGLYRDPEGSLQRWLTPPQKVSVDVSLAGVREVFWPIVEPDAIRALVAGLQTRDVVIADGHHRYETALAYQEERRAAEAVGETVHGYDYVMMYLAAVDDPGIAILPTHRVVAGIDMPDESRLLEQLGHDFGVERVGDVAAPLGERTNGSVTIGMYLGRGRGYLLHPREERVGNRDDLSVSVLQERILAPHLRISMDELATGASVSYTTDAAQACRWVDAGQAHAAFLLQATPLDRIWQSAVEDSVMPQKSTYFYPKLLTGLVLNPLDDDDPR